MKHLYILAAIFFASLQAVAQTFLMPYHSNGSITTSSGLLYDNAGTGYYGRYSADTLTIYPAVPGTKVRLNFSTFSLGYPDNLTIYDGVNTAAATIGTYQAIAPGVLMASNAAGALTLVFRSNTNYPLAGFEASISNASSTTAADLTILNAKIINPTSAPGSTLTFNCTHFNNGLIAALNSSVGFYLSTDTVLDAADSLLASSTATSSITGHNGVTANGTAPVPSGTAPGSYYILFVANYNHNVPNDTFYNNIVYRPLLIASNVPDLTITGVRSGTTIAYAGQYASLYCDVLNQGVANAAASSTGVYLSSDSLLDGADTLLTSNSVNALASGAYMAGSVVGLIPAATANGQYYLIAKLNYNGTVTEASTANNVRAWPITITNATSDLVAYQPVLTQYLVTPGGQTSGAVNVRNNGPVSTIASKVGIYISTDTVLGGGDTYIGSATTAGITGGAFVQSTFTNINTPSNLISGHYYLLFKADYLDTVTESNELNNVAWIDFYVQSQIDLYVASLTINTANAAPGGPLNITYQLANAGTQTPAAFHLGFYLSQDTVFDGGDILVADPLTYNLNGVTGNVTIPNYADTGSQYLLLYADDTHIINEFNETNNIKWAPIHLVASAYDLTVNNVQFPSTVTIGTAGQLTCRVNCTGNINFADSAKLGIYISTDGNLDVNDRLIDSATFGNILIGGYAAIDKYITVPADMAGGSYTLLLKADFTDSYGESDESNNVSGRAFTFFVPYVDLKFYGATFYTDNTIISAGSQISTHTLVTNAGNYQAPDGKVGIYLSADTVLDGGDVLLDSATYPAVNPGYLEPTDANVTIPAGTDTGAYYVLYYVDFNHAVNESVESNNTTYNPIRIDLPAVDLMPGSVTLTASHPVAGQSLQVHGLVYNWGTLASRDGKTGIYLSSDTIFDIDDWFLGDGDFDTIPASSYRGYNADIIIPTDIITGSYYLFAFADYQNVIAEGIEDNNLSMRPVDITGVTEIRGVAEMLFSISPNPASSILNLQMSLSNTKQVAWSIYNATGQVCMHDGIFEPGNKFQQRIDLNALPNGVYLLQLHTGEASIANKRFIVQH